MELKPLTNQLNYNKKWSINDLPVYSIIKLSNNPFIYNINYFNFTILTYKLTKLTLLIYFI